MRIPFRLSAVLTLLVLGHALPGHAQDSTKIKLFRTIQWTRGPVTGALGDEAEVSVPASCRFAGAAGAKTFLEVTENPPSGNEHGVLLCDPSDTTTGSWFVIFSYDPSGYVRDDEGKTLDAAAILSTIQEGTKSGNRERQSRGWDAIYVDGWERAPYYDTLTHNLTWSTRLHDESGQTSINHSVRLLGRGGVMHADLVGDPSAFATAVPRFDSILGGYHFTAGRTYAEWQQGDKMAGYGLTALVAGGAGVAAAKTGLLAKIFKPILALLLAAKKLIIIALIGVVAWLRSFLGGKRDSQDRAR